MASSVDVLVTENKDNNIVQKPGKTVHRAAGRTVKTAAEESNSVQPASDQGSGGTSDRKASAKRTLIGTSNNEGKYVLEGQNPRPVRIAAKPKVHPHGFKVLSTRSVVERSLRSYFRLPPPAEPHLVKELQGISKRLKGKRVEDKILDGFLLLRYCQVDDPEDATECALSGAGLCGAVAQDLAYFKYLEFVDAGENRFSLSDFACLPGLVELHLHCNYLSSISLPTVPDHVIYPALTTLNLSYNQLDGTALIPLMQISSLQRVDLSWNNMRNLPSDLSGFRNIKQLAIEHADLDNASLSCLATLPAVEEINVGFNPISEIILFTEWLTTTCESAPSTQRSRTQAVPKKTPSKEQQEDHVALCGLPLLAAGKRGKQSIPAAPFKLQGVHHGSELLEELVVSPCVPHRKPKDGRFCRNERAAQQGPVCARTNSASSLSATAEQDSSVAFKSRRREFSNSTTMPGDFLPFPQLRVLGLAGTAIRRPETLGSLLLLPELKRVILRSAKIDENPILADGVKNLLWEQRGITVHLTTLPQIVCPLREQHRAAQFDNPTCLRGPNVRETALAVKWRHQHTLNLFNPKTFVTVASAADAPHYSDRGPKVKRLNTRKLKEVSPTDLAMQEPQEHCSDKVNEKQQSFFVTEVNVTSRCPHKNERHSDGGMLPTPAESVSSNESSRFWIGNRYVNLKPQETPVQKYQAVVSSGVPVTDSPDSEACDQEHSRELLEKLLDEPIETNTVCHQILKNTDSDLLSKVRSSSRSALPNLGAAFVELRRVLSNRVSYTNGVALVGRRKPKPSHAVFGADQLPEPT
ncbi:putative Leucine-rich repeat protein [Diplonema papillatum]|nr:putative Leucine-rich repeat protein [Diplonema papillatum]